MKTLNGWIKKNAKLGGKAHLARECGVGWNTINAIAEGRQTPKLDLALAIMEATDWDIDIETMVAE